MSQPVPFLGEEKHSLHVSLQRHCDVVRWKVAGLDDDQLRSSVTPMGPNLIGLVKHLGASQFGWFCTTFGVETEPLPEWDGALRGDGEESMAEVMAFFERACAAADRSIAAHDMDAQGISWMGDTVSMRWVLIHMIEEVARHVGHIDIMRELIDGMVGDHDRS